MNPILDSGGLGDPCEIADCDDDAPESGADVQSGLETDGFEGGE